MSDYKIIARLSSYLSSLYVWNIHIWHNCCKGNMWKCCQTGKSEPAQYQKFGFYVCVWVLWCASLLGMILWTSYLRLLLCLSKSRRDSLGNGNRGFILPIIYCQWWRWRGTYASRYSSFLGPHKNGLRDGPRLNGGLLMHHVFTYVKQTLSCLTCISGLHLCAAFCAACSRQKAVFTWDICFHSKSFFWFFSWTYNKWPEMDETCNFWWTPAQVNTSSYHCLLHPFSAFLSSFLFMNEICNSVKQKITRIFKGRNFSFTQLCGEHCIFMYVT